MRDEGAVRQGNTHGYVKRTLDLPSTTVHQLLSDQSPRRTSLAGRGKENGLNGQVQCQDLGVNKVHAHRPPVSFEHESKQHTYHKTKRSELDPAPEMASRLVICGLVASMLKLTDLV